MRRLLLGAGLLVCLGVAAVLACLYLFDVLPIKSWGIQIEVHEDRTKQTIHNEQKW